jgi:hypothetical protein
MRTLMSTVFAIVKWAVGFAMMSFACGLIVRGYVQARRGMLAHGVVVLPLGASLAIEGAVAISDAAAGWARSVVVAVLCLVPFIAQLAVVRYARRMPAECSDGSVRASR